MKRIFIADSILHENNRRSVLIHNGSKLLCRERQVRGFVGTDDEIEGMARLCGSLESRSWVETVFAMVLALHKQSIGLDCLVI